MKTIITILLLAIANVAISQTNTTSLLDQLPPDTLSTVQQLITIHIPANTSFPFEATILERRAVVMTMNQARGLSMYAGKSAKSDSIIIISETSDSLLLQKIEELQQKVASYKISVEAALLSYEAEKMKNENSATAIAIKDELIKVQRKEIRRQKLQKWGFAIIAGTVTVLAIIG